ncbi:flap endonuclease-1 [Candidatus Woesearchaeota archaeon]|nr:MAG: flap endonuclease-1 [Candidatus Woesearchaeota archaeon]
MGVKLKDILIRRPLSLKDFSGKVLVVDAYNMLYQFLSNIRARDGSLLTDSRGNVTSHLIGLFSRCTNLMEKGVRLVFVFDGVVPELKHKELSRRAELKKEAARKYEAALAVKDFEQMQKFGARTSRLTKSMVGDAKRLLSLLGIPCVQAPSEGEAQAAFIVKRGDAWAVSSQDYDSLLFGAPRLVQNLSIEGRRKVPGKFSYVRVEPVLIDLDENLRNLGISQEKLLWLAVLVGTDYNPSGVKGIGPKKGLALVKEHETAESLFSSVELADDVDWRDVLKTFEEIKVTDNYTISWHPVDKKGLFDFLVNERDFSEVRVNKFLGSLCGSLQKGLGDFL